MNDHDIYELARSIKNIATKAMQHAGRHETQQALDALAKARARLDQIAADGGPKKIGGGK